MATSNLTMRPAEIEMITAVNAMQRAVDPLYPDISKQQPMRPAEIELLEAVNTLRDKFELFLGVLNVYGKSVQDGTPTPESPVPITSIETLTIDADESSVPIDLQGHQLRSLPDGTHDTLTLTYLRPSSRDGWVWYSGEVTRDVHVITLDGSEGWGNDSHGCFHTMNELAVGADNSYANTIVCDQLKAYPRYVDLDGITGISGYRQYGQSGANWLYARVEEVGSNAIAMKAWLAEHRQTVLYKTNESPTTEALDPIELPDIGNVASMHITANDDIVVEYDYDYVIRRTIVNG